jgi:hypothetical protein
MANRDDFILIRRARLRRSYLYTVVAHHRLDFCPRLHTCLYEFCPGSIHSFALSQNNSASISTSRHNFVPVSPASPFAHAFFWIDVCLDCVIRFMLDCVVVPMVRAAVSCPLDCIVVLIVCVAFSCPIPHRCCSASGVTGPRCGDFVASAQIMDPGPLLLVQKER